MRRALVLTGVAIFAAAPAAHAAGTVTHSSAGADVEYQTATAANVVVTDALDGAGDIVVTLSETGISLGMPSVGCSDDGNSVSCVVDGDQAGVETDLSPQGDVFDASALAFTTLSHPFGSDGDDEIHGGDDAFRDDGFPIGDSIRGGDGTDRIFGGAGNDGLGTSGGGAAPELVEGGPGDDSVTELGNDPVGDIFRGGEGIDEIWARGGSMVPTQVFTVDLAADTVTEATGVSGTDVIESFEDARSDLNAGATLLGDDGPNRLTGGEDVDTIDGGLGSDRLFGDSGDDQLRAQDGVADRVDGQTGTDTCLLDQLDEHSGCENPQIATLPPFGVVFPDLDEPDCTVAAGKARRPARQVARRGVTVRVNCDEAGRASATLLGRLRRLDRGARLARAGDIELASRSAALGADGDGTLRLRVRRQRRLLRRGVRLRLRVSVVDASGNRSRPIVRRLRLR